MSKISMSETISVAKKDLTHKFCGSLPMLADWIDQIQLLEGWVEHLYPAETEETILKIVEMRIEGNKLTYTVESPVDGLIATLDLKLMNLQLKHEFGTAMLVLEEKPDAPQSL